jgi:hypothetical protein
MFEQGFGELDFNFFDKGFENPISKSEQSFQSSIFQNLMPNLIVVKLKILIKKH